MLPSVPPSPLPGTWWWGQVGTSTPHSHHSCAPLTPGSERAWEMDKECEEDMCGVNVNSLEKSTAPQTHLMCNRSHAPLHE